VCAGGTGAALAAGLFNIKRLKGVSAFIVGRIVQFGRGMIVLTVLTPEVLLAMVVAAGVNVGSLLFELNRHRASIAGLL